MFNLAASLHHLSLVHTLSLLLTILQLSFTFTPVPRLTSWQHPTERSSCQPQFQFSALYLEQIAVSCDGCEQEFLRKWRQSLQGVYAGGQVSLLLMLPLS